MPFFSYHGNIVFRQSPVKGIKTISFSFHSFSFGKKITVI